jgi:GH15 family glucan-1,4-alpha-glucosidase
MAQRIEDYALIGDCETAALVGRNGSIDWLCLPRFDSGACFASLLGTPEHGHWSLAPAGTIQQTRRRYRPGTLVLETEFDTAEGSVTLVDCMPPRGNHPYLVRTVVGQRGQVRMRMELTLRFDYGSIVPWVREIPGGLLAIAGPDAVRITTPVPLRGEDMHTVAEFTVSEGQEIPFVLRWHPSNEEPCPDIDAAQAIAETESFWREWSDRCSYTGPWKEQVQRSLITLKALTYRPTGGIVAAATTSLPEQIGGVRNWDYRFCWLRDATFTLYALMNAGYTEEAAAWRDWLLRAVAGQPGQINIMYGLRGERRLTEVELSWLPGYENSAPVRVGNAAYQQLQLDVFGEVMGALHLSRMLGLDPDGDSWSVQRTILDYLETGWHQPDEGIWEVRGPRRHFTHSKVMAWMAFDCAIQDLEKFHLEGPLDRWKQVRAAIHDEVCAKGFDSTQNSFVQYYGATDLDASLLMIPLVRFLPATDPRVQGTVAAIERNLLTDGFVRRYPTHKEVDGLPPGEGVFLPCTFWLADNYTLMGRHKEAEALFERMLGLCNDVGLLSEEYDVHGQRLVGNFPQAFSHVGLVNTACTLCRSHSLVVDRMGRPTT